MRVPAVRQLPASIERRPRGMAADDIHLEARVKCFSWLVAHACAMHSGIPRPRLRSNHSAGRNAPLWR